MGASDGTELLERQPIPRAALLALVHASSWVEHGGAALFGCFHGVVKEEKKGDCDSHGLKIGERQGLEKEVIAFVLPDALRKRVLGSYSQGRFWNSAL